MATRGKKLSDAYIELRAEDSKLTGDVKVKATRAAKGFGAALNNALRVLDIDPIDVKADPKTALASIESARTRLRELSRDADTVEMRLRTERALAQLEGFRRQLGAVDEEPAVVEVDDSPARRRVEQLQKRLASLGIDPPVTIDADPKTALAALRRVDEQLEELSRTASSVQVRMDAEAARRDLDKLKDQVEEVGDESAERFSTSFVARLGPLLARMPLSGPVAAAVGVAALAAVPQLSALIAGAVVGGAGVGGIVGGVALASRDERVRAAGRDLGTYLLSDLENRADVFVDPLLDGIEDVRAGWRDLAPDIQRILAGSGDLIEPLLAGALSGARGLVDGVADAVEEAEPVVAALGFGLARIGEATGDAFSLLAEDADEAASAIDDATAAVSRFINVAAGILHVAATVKGYTDEVDVAIDRGRYWVEDSSYLADALRELGINLDITADGFKAGSKEAEAYRKATLGTAEAADFATLKAAGLTDAEIAAADASGTFRTRLDEVNRSLGMSSDGLVATQEDTKQLQAELDRAGAQFKLLGDIGVDALNGLMLESGALSAAMVRQANTADMLRQAHEQMYGAAIAQNEANEAFEASWDRLSGAVDRNGRSLKMTSEAGRANRDALQELLVKSTEMYHADIAAGMAVDEARKKHEARIGAIRTEAGQLRLNKTETEKLISTYGNIPPKRTTDLLLEGVDRIVSSLTDLYIYQRSLAEGITLGQAKAAVTGTYGVDPRILKGYHGGGEVSGWSPTPTADNIPAMLTAREFVQPVRTVDYYGVAAMEAIRHRQIPREALQHYAAGGLVGAPWSRRMLYETDVGGTRIPSRQEVASKVMPAFGAWPSSPAAQRGDSGIWRRILAIVQAAGIPYDFGNAYRPGDPLWHGSGRAVDFMGYNLDRLANFFMARQSQVLELIHRTDTRDYAITRGRRTTMPTQLPLHRNHLHVAMANGGVIREPILGVGASGRTYSFGEGYRPETVVPGVGASMSTTPAADAVVEELRGLRRDLERLPIYQVPDAGRRATVLRRGV